MIFIFQDRENSRIFIEIRLAFGRSYGAFFIETNERVYPERLPLRIKTEDAVRNLRGFAKEKDWIEK